MPASAKKESEFFSTLPVCILKDDYCDGKRIPQIHFNDKFKPIRKALLKSTADILQPEYAYTPYHYHDGIEILCVHEGEAKIVINNQSHTAKQNDIFIVNSFEAHGIYIKTKKARLARTCITFRQHYIFPPEGGQNHFFTDLKNLCFENHIPAESTANPPLRACIEHITDLGISQPDGWLVAVLSDIIKIYALVLQYGAHKEQPPNASFLFDFMAKVSTYIESHIDEDISTCEIAAYCQYSTEHFCRLFKKCFDKSFKDYLNIYRIQRAQYYINIGKYTTIAEIASKCGFNNQNHFGAMFKKYTGLLPSEYITQQKEILDQEKDDFQIL
ncbi:MAG: helix-turn-helix transcriptional regulator [Clostridia bacterium]|nr:helix-turn-helix transcriptional regulator [Clostridia bacterium]